MAATSVMPEREVPGISASDWASPTSRGVTQREGFERSLVARGLLDYRHQQADHDEGRRDDQDRAATGPR